MEPTSHKLKAAPVKVASEFVSLRIRTNVSHLICRATPTTKVNNLNCFIKGRLRMIGSRSMKTLGNESDEVVVMS